VAIVEQQRHYGPRLVVPTVTASVDLDKPRQKLGVQLSKQITAQKYGTSAGTDMMLTIRPIIPAVDMVDPSIAPATIIPQMPTPFVPAFTLAQTVNATVVSVFSPFPSTILGMGSAVGAMMLSLGTTLLAEIAMEIGQEGMQRVASKTFKNFKVKLRTGQGEGRGRPVIIRPPEGGYGGEQGNPNAEDNCKLYEFWCWMV